MPKKAKNFEIRRKEKKANDNLNAAHSFISTQMHSFTWQKTFTHTQTHIFSAILVYASNATKLQKVFCIRKTFTHTKNLQKTAKFVLFIRFSHIHTHTDKHVNRQPNRVEMVLKCVI